MGAAFGRPHKGGAAAFGGRPTFVGTIMDGHLSTFPSVSAHLGSILVTRMLGLPAGMPTPWQEVQHPSLQDALGCSILVFIYKPETRERRGR